MKELTINGHLYCKYEMDGNTLYLKVLLQFPNTDKFNTEMTLFNLIELIENRKFKQMSFLNV